MTRRGIESAISAEYGIDTTSLYGNTLGKEKAIVSTVRAIYWTLLKEDFGIPVSTIAKEFDRTPRCIYKAISKMSWGIRNLPYYREIVRKIKESAS